MPGTVRGATEQPPGAHRPEGESVKRPLRARRLELFSESVRVAEKVSNGYSLETPVRECLLSSVEARALARPGLPGLPCCAFKPLIQKRPLNDRSKTGAVADTPLAELNPRRATRKVPDGEALGVEGGLR